MKRYKVSVNNKIYDLELISRNQKSASFNIACVRYDIALQALSGKENEGQSSGAQATPEVRGGPAAVSPQFSVASSGSLEVKAPMAGLISQVLVKAGQEVKRGDSLVIIEAMKMENPIASPRAGKIEAIEVKPGQEVTTKSILLRFEA